MAREDSTPLLSSDSDGRLNDVYQRFSPTRKNIILAMVSMCGVINYCLTESFTPSIPQIAKDLNSTGVVVNIAVSMSVLASSLGGLIASTYSTFYGRRPVYLCTLPVYVMGAAGVAAAQSIPSFFFWRFFQSMGASLGPILGAAVIGDIFKLEERGSAMGVFFAAALSGTTFAPVAAGWITHYYSWRVVHCILGLIGLTIFTTIFFLLPETSHPGARGIDKMKVTDGPEPSRSFIFINPFQPLWLLRSPSMLLTGIIVAASQMCIFVLSVPLPYTIGIRYHITNEALIGACLLPAGIGSMIGTPIVGRLADYTVIKWRRKRKGAWYPEDRLRASFIPFVLIVPLSLLAFGVVNRFVDGRLGLVLSLVCLFFGSAGVDMTYAVCVAYLVDVVQTRSSEILAATFVMRSVLVAIAVAAFLPMINALGIALAYLLCAGFIWIASGCLYYTLKYGDEMRAWLDIGFSTAEDDSKHFPSGCT